MAYEVLGNEVNVLIKQGDNEGERTPFDNESRLFYKGETVEDDEISDVVKVQYDNGDKHVLSLLKRIDDPAKKRGRPAAKETPEA